MSVSGGTRSPRRAFRRLTRLILLAALALGIASPVAAQFSESFKFLEAVRKADGSVVQDALNKPGTTIINTRDVTSGESALHIVAKRRDKTWMSFLLERGANPNARDRNGVTPMQIASSLGFVEGVELLLQYRANPSDANDAGETPLITATHHRDLVMVKLLLGSGADPVRPDNSGRSARDYAKLDGQDQIVAAFDGAAKRKPAADPNKPSYGPSL